MAGNRQPNRARNAGKRVGPRDRDVLPPKEFTAPEVVQARRARELQASAGQEPAAAELQRRERRSEAGTYARSVKQVRYLRAALAAEELRAVRMGRELGASWDRIGAAVGVPGETLRRRYAGKL